MSEPRKINDHSFWAGSRGKNSVLPDGPHKVKVESSVEGAGHLSGYEDRDEDIKSNQKAGVSKLEGRKLKPGYRN